MCIRDRRIVAGNAKEFVHELRVGSWMDSDCTDEQYMHNFAERYVGQSGVRTVSYTHLPLIECLERELFDERYTVYLYTVNPVSYTHLWDFRSLIRQPYRRQLIT